MRLALLISSVFAALCFSSCSVIDEGNKNCPPDEGRSVTLSFVYKNEQGADIFSQRVEKVDLGLFDMNGNLLQIITKQKSDLNLFQGAKLELEPGTYRVICWGNILANAGIAAPLAASTVESSRVYVLSGDGSATDDPLYYAPNGSASKAPGDNIFTLNVPQNGDVNETIDFYYAHVDLRVIVIGMEDPDGGGANMAPKIEVTGTPSKYDFAVMPREGAIRYEKLSEYVANGQVQEARAEFFTKRFETTSATYINIYRISTGSVERTVDLSSYLQQKSIDISQLAEPVITVTVDFTKPIDLGVTIKVEGWDSTGVDPEL